MTAQELIKMASIMNNHNANIKTRTDLSNYSYCLMHGLKAIGRNELANELKKIYDEIENVDTCDLTEKMK